MSIAEFLHVLAKSILFILYKTADFFKNFGRNLKHLLKNGRVAFKYFLKLASPYFKAMKSKLVLIWGCVCIACIIIVVVLLNMTVNYYQISYNGLNLGYSRSIKTVNAVMDDLRGQFVDNQTVISDLDAFEITQIQTNNWFLNCLKSKEIEQVIVISAESIDYAYAVYSDGENLIYSASQKTVENAINDYRHDRIVLSADINRVYDSCDVEWLVDLKVEKVCTTSDIITYEGIYDTLYKQLEESVPYRITCIQTEDVSIPYITHYERNEDLYSGSKMLIRAGANGKKKVTSKLIVENGVLVSSEIINEKITKNATTCKIQIGSAIDEFTDTGSSLVLPVEGYVTSGYGPRSDPFTGEPDHHTGLDISAKTGTEIWAAAAGKVIKASDTGNGYGKCVIIEHYSGFRTLYGHCSELLVSVGDYVTAGDLIAKVGSTGRSTGPHLHFSVIIDGEYVDPTVYF